MSTSVDTLDFVASEFTGLSDSVKETALKYAAQRMDAPTWGQLYEQGAAYLAAHLLKVRQRNAQMEESAGAGGVDSVSTGDLSVSFGGGGDQAQTLSEEALSTTDYGQQYLHLRGQLAAGAGFVADGS